MTVPICNVVFQNPSLSTFATFFQRQLLNNSYPRDNSNPNWEKHSFASRCIDPGRSFMHQQWDTCKCFQKSHYHIKLAGGPLTDLELWLTLLKEWSGKSFLLHIRRTPAPDTDLFTDASGSIGWGLLCWPMDPRSVAPASPAHDNRVERTLRHPNSLQCLGQRLAVDADHVAVRQRSHCCMP